MANIRYTDFSAGVVTNVNKNIRPPNSVDLAINFDFDEEIGSAVTRLGTAQIGSQLVNNNAILGVHQHIDTANSSNNKLFATINASGGATSVVYDVVAGTTSVTGLTASKKMRFLTFLGATLAINGTDAERSYTSSGWITTGGAFDLADYPGSNSCDLAIEFLDRVYTAGDSTNPSRVHFSTIASSGVISWAGDFFDVEPEDGGGPITAFGKVPGYILIFKERSLHRFNGSSAFPESLIQIGTPSQESVVLSGGLCAFYSNSNEGDKGFWITNGQRPIPISHDHTRPIKKWVDAISTSNEANIAGFATNHGYAWSIGDVTVDGESYTNVFLRYNRILNQWSVRTYPTEFKVFAQYLVGGINTIVGGDDDGNVIRIDKAATYSDAPSTTAIPYLLRTHADDYGTNTQKIVSDRALLRGTSTDQAVIRAIPDKDLTKAIHLGKPSFFSKIKSLLGLSQHIEATAVALEVSGLAEGSRVTLEEIELIKVEDQKTYQ